MVTINLRCNRNVNICDEILLKNSEMLIEQRSKDNPLKKEIMKSIRETFNPVNR